MLIRHKPENKNKRFNTPTTWQKPKNKEDCYICLTDVQGYNRTKSSKIVYPKVSSVTRASIAFENTQSTATNEGSTSTSAVVQDEIASMIDQLSIDENSDESETSGEVQSDEYIPSGYVSKSVRLYSQKALNDLVRDLGLSKEAAELLASDLKKRGMVEKETKSSFYRTRDQQFRKFFKQEEDLVYCLDVKGLMNELKLNCYKDEDWRLFIDSSIRSSKVVLLHNSNKFAPVPIAHSVTLKEEYSNMKMVLENIKYAEHNWKICGDLKIISIILGQQSGYTKYPCFMCLWDSRDRDNRYKKSEWPERKKLEPGSVNILHEPLVEPTKVLLPPLHIKLGLMKQFVKALNKEGKCFQYIQRQFLNISDAKLKEGIFDGPQIRTLMKDENFINRMTKEEKSAWLSFKKVVENFLGNNKSLNYKIMVEKLTKSYKKLSCLMNLKLHFLHSHLDYFPVNLGDFSEEQGKRFHQDIKEMERRYQGRWDVNMMADFCWCLKREDVQKEIKRKRNPLRRSFQSKKTRKREITLL